jgi:hypothetical protein
MSMRYLARIALALTCVLIISEDLIADHPTLSLGESNASPLTTISAIPLDAGQSAFGFQQQMIFNDELTDAELESSSDLGEDVHSVESVYSTSFGGAFGITDNLTFGFQLPYVSRQNIREAHHEDEGFDEGHGDPVDEHHDDAPGHEEAVEQLGDSSGMGDTTFYGQYRFWNSANEDVNAALLFGIKTPTGRTNAMSVEGERFETELQPGSGSWDLFTGLAASRSAGRVGFDTNILYTFANEGSQNTTLGDVFNYNFALSFHARGKKTDQHAHPDEKAHEHTDTVLDFIFELNGDWREKVEKPGGTDNNTGGNIIYLSAATRASWGRGWSAYFSAGVPVLKDLNGIQSEPKARLLFGISKGF